MKKAIVLLLTASMACAAMADAAPKSFTIGALGDKDYSLQGCTRTLSRGMSDLFVEDGIDTAAQGFMKINGKVIRVGLKSIKTGGKHTIRVFTSKDGKLSVSENLVTGEAHEESDSVEESGTLTITWSGMTQTIKVSGGTAC